MGGLFGSVKYYSYLYVDALEFLGGGACALPVVHKVVHYGRGNIRQVGVYLFPLRLVR